jgi:hypothetical protein
MPFDQKFLDSLDADIKQAEENAQRWQELKESGGSVEIPRGFTPDTFIAQYRNLARDLKSLRDDSAR